MIGNLSREILSIRRRLYLWLGQLTPANQPSVDFLSSGVCLRGLRVGLVDTDVGQSQIGPPTTIGVKILFQNPDWDTVEADSLYFVGWISPEGHLLQCVTGVRLMVDAAFKARRRLCCD